jgi:hypothetical protein
MREGRGIAETPMSDTPRACARVAVRLGIHEPECESHYPSVGRELVEAKGIFAKSDGLIYRRFAMARGKSAIGLCFSEEKNGKEGGIGFHWPVGGTRASHASPPRFPLVVATLWRTAKLAASGCGEGGIRISQAQQPKSLIERVFYLLPMI